MKKNDFWFFMLYGITPLNAVGIYSTTDRQTFIFE